MILKLMNKHRAVKDDTADIDLFFPYHWVVIQVEKSPHPSVLIAVYPTVDLNSSLKQIHEVMYQSVISIPSGLP